MLEIVQMSRLGNDLSWDRAKLCAWLVKQKEQQQFMVKITHSLHGAVMWEVVMDEWIVSAHLLICKRCNQWYQISN